MGYPIVVAIAKLSPGSRKLLTFARSIAMAGDDAELKSIHLFMAASKMGRIGAGRLVPAKCKAQLEANLMMSLQIGIKEDLSFLPVSLSIRNACICLAKSRRRILPEDLLVQVFREDEGCRNVLVSILGSTGSQALEEKLLLKDFDSDERRRIRRIKGLFEEESDDANDRYRIDI